MRAVAILVVIAVAEVAQAHPLDLGYLRIDDGGSKIAVQLDLDHKAAAIVLGVASESLTPTTIQSHAAALAERSFARAAIVSAAGPCAWAESAAALQGQTVTIANTATCPTAGSRRWRFPFVADRVVSPRFQLIVKESGAGSERLTLIDETTTEIELAGSANRATNSATAFPNFVWSGVEHIGVAPSEWTAEDGGVQLPDGIDHILFLLALMLGGGTLAQLLIIATGFTLGHSVTLALAVLDIVRPPASIIEPLIALSIAIAAADAFTTRWRSHRWKIASGFGLIHGFGFAAALGHLELSAHGKASALFGYNLGIELGQIVVVLIVAPLVLVAHRRGNTLAIRGAAGVILLCGLYWFASRSVALLY